MNASARDVNRHHTHLHTKMNVNRTLLSRWETAKYTARKREGGREENITLSVHSIYVLCLMWYATSWLIHLNQTTIISYSSQFEENKNWPQFGYSRLQFPNDMFLNILPIICWLSVYFTKWEWTCLFFPTSFHFVNNGIHSILQTYRTDRHLYEHAKHKYTVLATVHRFCFDFIKLIETLYSTQTNEIPVVQCKLFLFILKRSRVKTVKRN